MADCILRDDALAVVKYAKDKVEGIRNLPAVDNGEIDRLKKEIEFTRKFVFEHGLHFALASAWAKECGGN